MQVVIDHKSGLFPLSGEMKFQCSCPDWADMCKHVAAVLYGVGARLDKSPQELFKLRGVNHKDLILADAESAVSAATTKKSNRGLKEKDLADVFGIELVADVPQTTRHAAHNHKPKIASITVKSGKVIRSAARSSSRTSATKKRRKTATRWHVQWSSS